MKKFIRISCGVAMLCFLVGTPGANATVLTYTASTGFQDLSPFDPDPIPLFVPQFNTALGTLTSITLTLGAVEKAQVTIENGSSAASTNVRVSLTGIVDTTTPSTPDGDATVALTINSSRFTLAANGAESGTPTYNGTGADFHDLGTLTASKAATNLLTDTGDFTPYLGLGNAEIDVDGQGGWSFSGTSAADLRINSFQGEGNVSITYQYTPIPPSGIVPEPSMFCMFGLGLIGVVFRKRIIGCFGRQDERQRV